MTELHSAPPRDIPRIQLELQKLRVEQIVLREVALSMSDPNAYKEMNLLNRMMLAFDDEENDLNLEEDRQKEVTARLEKRGISPESARRLIKVLSSAVPPAEVPKVIGEVEEDENDIPETVVN